MLNVLGDGCSATAALTALTPLHVTLHRSERARPISSSPTSAASLLVAAHNAVAHSLAVKLPHLN
jgi:hypothetical protein